MKRDPWAWAVLLAIVPLALKLLGAPVGEPVAEDFDFLRHALLTDQRSLLDGGGSMSFWRPIAHQLYYLALGPLILSAPVAVAAIHLAFLAAGSLLVYFALRRSWSLHPAAAAVAATFPLIAESTRTLVAWPTQFVDVGLYFFSALAIHERAAKRMPSALAALLAALLCKEVTVVTGVMLAFWPDASERRDRVRWLVGTGVLLALWAAVFLWVRSNAGLHMPHNLEGDPRLLRIPVPLRLWWAFSNSLRAVMSLALRPDRWDFLATLGVVAVLGAAVLVLVRSESARAELKRARPWAVWGVVWFMIASLAIATIFPLWQPNRAHFGSLGLGIAASALLAASGRGVMLALVAVRVVMLLIAPGAVTTVETDPPERGAFMDFQRLSRLERLMRLMRTSLREHYPTLPHGAAIAQHNLPRAAEYALGGSHALQVWYRDTTLHWIRFEEFQKDRDARPLSMMAFEPLEPRQISFVEPQAARALLDAVAMAQARRYPEAMVLAGRAESTLTDPGAKVIRSSAAAVRATSLASLGHLPEAEAEAVRSIRLYRRNADANFLLGLFRLNQKRFAEAAAHLAEADAAMPGDSLTRAMLERARASARDAR